MSYFFRVFLVYLFFILTPNEAHAGDIMPEGTVLAQESYVFTVDEAKDLLKRIEDLEKKEEKLNYYIELEAIRDEKYRLTEANIDLYKFQISEYQNIVTANTLELNRLHKRDKNRWLENYGMLFLGMAITTGTFLAADAINDHMESN